MIYLTAGLDAATARLESELGLPAIGGGRHEKIGTMNRIIPFGQGYLEVLTIADNEEASTSTLGRAIQARLRDVGEGLYAWAIAVEDVAPVAARLGVSTSTIARDGLTAGLAGLEEALREPFLPFFIARDPGVADPAAAGEAGGITWIEVAGDAERLEEWLGDAELAVRVVDGEPGVRAVGIGDRELRA